MTNVVNRYGVNQHGNDYVVGDIHGCYTLLERELERIGFNESSDRLFSVGDLCDRGPESIRVLEFLRQPWFHPVHGNHDTFIILAYETEVKKTITDAAFVPFWRQVGGKWWQHTTKEQREELYHYIKQTPYFIQIDTRNHGRVGIVHAEIPIGVSWNACVAKAEQNDDTLIDHIVWARDRIVKNNKSGVPGIDHVFCGHTVIQRINEYRQRLKKPPQDTITVPFTLGNVNYIDTGAYFAPDNGVEIPHGGEVGDPPYGLTVHKL